MSVRPLAGIGLLAALFAAPLRSADAQREAYVPLDEPSYLLIDAIRARGGLQALSMLERPYRLADLERAIAQEEQDTLRSPGSARLVRSLRSALRLDRLAADSAGAATRLRATASALATAQTTGRRTLALAADDPTATVGGATGTLGLESGRLVAVARLRLDGQLREAPEYVGKQDRSLVIRVEDGYVGARWRHGEIVWGRVARNLGPAPLDGLQLSGAAFSFDHLFARVGTSRVHLLAMLAPLDPYLFGRAARDDARAALHLPAPRLYPYEEPSDSSASRWFALHRLAVRVGDLEIGLTESTTWGGVGRGFEGPLANPLGFWTLSQYSERQVSNPSLGADVAWRHPRVGLLAAQLMLDDVQFDDCGPVCDEPTSYGATFTAEGVPLPAGARGFASYTRVSNLAYRTLNPWERYASYDVGIGRPESDYDEWQLGAELVGPGVVMRPYVLRRRQGEGDYRRAFPEVAAFPDTPAFLSGRPWTVTRLAVRAGVWVGDRAALSADVGYQRARDVAHLSGATSRGLEGRIRVELRAPVVTLAYD